MNIVSARTLLRLLTAAGLAAVALVAVPPGSADAAGVPCQRTFFSTGTANNKTIPDNGSVPSIIDVPEDGLVVADVDVSVNIHHTVDNSLFVALLSVTEENFDTRASSVLFDRGGGDGDNLLGTVFDDEAADPVTWGEPPFTGRYEPVRPLSVHDGFTGGKYSLIAGDHDLGIGLGTLDNWSLTLTYVSCDLDADGVEDHADGCLGLAAASPSGCPLASRVMSASHRKGKVTGRLSSPVAGCASGREVTVWRVRRGPDRKVRTTRTRSDGSFRLARVKSAGRYYATSPRVVVLDAAECPAVQSRTFRVR
jgi:hypothetical protein